MHYVFLVVDRTIYEICFIRQAAAHPILAIKTIHAYAYSIIAYPTTTNTAGVIVFLNAVEEGFGRIVGTVFDRRVLDQRITRK